MLFALKEENAILVPSINVIYCVYLSMNIDLIKCTLYAVSTYVHYVQMVPLLLCLHICYWTKVVYRPIG